MVVTSDAGIFTNPGGRSDQIEKTAPRRRAPGEWDPMGESRTYRSRLYLDDLAPAERDRILGNGVTSVRRQDKI
jgi:hypothetical protein